MKLLIDYLNGLADHLASGQLLPSEFMAHMQGAVALAQFKSEIDAAEAVMLRTQAIEICENTDSRFEDPNNMREDEDGAWILEDNIHPHYGIDGKVRNG